MRQILYLVQKEFRQIFRDFSMVRILFVVPLIQIFILGNAITTNVKNIKIVFEDQDKTPYSREFISRFVHSRYFRITGFEEDYTRLSSYLDSGKANLAIVIPRHFQRDIVLQKKPAIQLLVDGVDGNSAGVSLGYITDIVQKYQERLMEASPDLSLQVKNVRRVEMEPRFWFNPNLESKLYRANCKTSIHRALARPRIGISNREISQPIVEALHGQFHGFFPDFGRRYPSGVRTPP